MGTASSRSSRDPSEQEAEFAVAMKALYEAWMQVSEAALETSKWKRELTEWRRQAVRSAAVAECAVEDRNAAQAELETLRYAAGTVGVGLLAAAVGGGLWARGMHGRLERVAAELKASGRRADAELEKAKRYGGERLAKALVPVSDNLDALLLAAEEAPADEGRAKALLEGAQLTQHTLLSALRSQDVAKVAPSAGAAFDPHTMEALFTVPVGAAAELRQPGVVATVVRPGFLLHERVIRAAQVGVTTGEGAAAQGAVEGEAPEPLEGPPAST